MPTHSQGRVGIVRWLLTVTAAGLVGAACTTVPPAPTTPTTDPPSGGVDLRNVVPPSASGLPLSGFTLTAGAGTWSEEPASVDVNWLSCDERGEGCESVGTGSALVLSEDEVGRRVQVEATATSGPDTVTAVSALSAVIAAGPPVNTSPPQIFGAASVGSTLQVVSPGAWANEPTAYEFVWLSCDAAGAGCEEIANATDYLLVVDEALLGRRLRVRVTATNEAGSASAESLLSSPVSPAGFPTSQFPSILIGGGKWIGDEVRPFSAWTAATSITTTWEVCDSTGEGCEERLSVTRPGDVQSPELVPGYQLTAADEGRYVRALETASNAAGEATLVSPLHGPVVENGPPTLFLDATSWGFPSAGPVVGRSDFFFFGPADQIAAGVELEVIDNPYFRLVHADEVAYSWERCTTPDVCTGVGTDDRYYVTTADDVGFRMAARLVASNPYGQLLGTSAGSLVVPPSVPEAFETYANFPFDGVLPGDELSGFMAPFENGRVVSVWERCSADGANCVPIPGTEKPLREDQTTAYTVAVEDVGFRIRRTETRTNAAGVAVASSELSTVVQTPVAPVSVKVPAVAFDRSVPTNGFRVYVSDFGEWSGTRYDLSVRWLRCDPSGAGCETTEGTDWSYTLTSADVGRSMRAEVTASNPAGSATALSAPSPVVIEPPAPTNTALPTTSGSYTNDTLVPGGFVHGSYGGWSDTQSYASSWLRCGADGLYCEEIPGASTTVYQLTEADVGRSLKLQVTGSNAVGSTVAVSRRTDVVLPVGAPAPLNQPSIPLGRPTAASVGEVLTATPASWINEPTVTKRWRRCDPSTARACTWIPGAEGNVYIVSGDDIGYRLEYAEVGTNDRGSAEAKASAGVIAKSARPSAAGSIHLLTGPNRLGSTLTAPTLTWTGTTTVTSRWVRCPRSGADCVDIPDANERSYQLTAADVGQRVRYVEDGLGPGGVNTIATQPSGIVVDGTTPPTGWVLQSGNDAGQPISQVGGLAAISDDSRFLVYSATVREPFNGQSPPSGEQVYLRDRVTGLVTLVSVGIDGQPGNAASTRPVISPNGRFIAFVSSATNLASVAPSAVPQVYAFDRETGELSSRSVDEMGTPADSPAYSPSIADTGRVLFSSGATNLPGTGRFRYFTNDGPSSTTTMVLNVSFQADFTDPVVDDNQRSLSPDGTSFAVRDNYRTPLSSGCRSWLGDTWQLRWVHIPSGDTELFPKCSESWAVANSGRLALHLPNGSQLWERGESARPVLKRPDGSPASATVHSITPNGERVGLSTSDRTLTPDQISDRAEAVTGFVFDAGTGQQRRVSERNGDALNGTENSVFVTSTGCLATLTNAADADESGSYYSTNRHLYSVCE
jgi:hypothetical protein